MVLRGQLTRAGFTRPPRLRRGDVIGVIAPSSPQRDDERLRRGIRYFESNGYRVEAGVSLWRRHGYLAGTDAERAADLNAMIRNPHVRMIIAGRGGYGVTRILDRVDYAALARDPKIIVGFSDVTALNLAVLKRSRLVSFSGAMPGVDFADPEAIDPVAEESFWRSVTSAAAPGRIAGGDDGAMTMRPGRAEGWMLAGNLTLLAAVTGTRWMPRGEGAVLLTEEIGEESYRVDRLLSQLWGSGLLRRLSGLAFGAFTDAEPRRVSVAPLPLDEVLGEYVARADVPAIGGVRYGHVPTKLTVPLGVWCVLDGRRATLRLTEAGVC